MDDKQMDDKQMDALNKFKGRLVEKLARELQEARNRTNDLRERSHYANAEAARLNRAFDSSVDELIVLEEALDNARAK